MADAGTGHFLEDGMPAPGKHMPTLDCVRGIAIAATVLFHGLGSMLTRYWAVLSPLERNLLYAVNFGFLGVYLFFVLSGFLITGILLDTRHSPGYYKRFYLRRALRILPMFLLTAITLRVLGLIGWSYFFFSLCFLANLASRSDANAQYTGFWTLAVEEQFYLVWPTVVRRLQPRTLFMVAVLLVVLTPPLRYAVGMLPAHFSDMRFKTWDCLDFFGAGAALSLLVRSARTRPHLGKVIAGLFALAALLFGVQVLARNMLSVRAVTSVPAAHLIELTLFPPWVMLFAAAVLVAFLHPAWAATLAGRALAFLGSISYGLYLIHGIFQIEFEKRWSADAFVGNHLVIHGVAMFFLWAVPAVLVSWLSRRTFEEYFLRRKHRQTRLVEDPHLVA